MKSFLFCLSALLLAVDSDAAKDSFRQDLPPPVHLSLPNQISHRRLTAPGPSPVAEHGVCEIYYNATTNQTTIDIPCASGLACELNHPVNVSAQYDGTCEGSYEMAVCQLIYTSSSWKAYSANVLFCGHGTVCVASTSSPTNGAIHNGTCVYGVNSQPCQVDYTKQGNTHYFLPSSTAAGVYPGIPECGNNLECVATGSLPNNGGIVSGICQSGNGTVCYQAYIKDNSTSGHYVYTSSPCPSHYDCVLNSSQPLGDTKANYSGVCQLVGELGDACQRQYLGNSSNYTIVDYTSNYASCSKELSCVVSGVTLSGLADLTVLNGTCKSDGKLNDVCQNQYNGKSSHEYITNFPACGDNLVCFVESDPGTSDIVTGTCQYAFCEGDNNHGNKIDTGTLRVTICHRTCSETNPWVRITIDDDAWNGTQASGCGHQQHWVNGTCTGKNLTYWGSHDRDYLLMDHGTYGSHDKAYWDIWEPACPYVRSDKLHNPCCNRTAGECCGDPPVVPSTPAPVPAPTPAPFVCVPPLTSTETSPCDKDIKVLEKDGSSSIGSDPIVITTQADGYVTFNIKKQWDSNGTVFVQYFDPVAQQYYCVESCNGTTIRAHCLTTVPIAIVEIWVETGNPSDNANISSCCFEQDFATQEKIEAATGVDIQPVNTTGKHYIEGTYEVWCQSKCVQI